MYHFAEFSYDTLAVNICTVPDDTSVIIASTHVKRIQLSVKFSTLSYD